MRQWRGGVVVGSVMAPALIRARIGLASVRRANGYDALSGDLMVGPGDISIHSSVLAAEHDLACEGCGYHKCSCARAIAEPAARAEPALPAGWAPVECPDESESEAYVHAATRAQVWLPRGLDIWLYERGRVSGNAELRDDAMRYALEGWAPAAKPGEIVVGSRVCVADGSYPARYRDLLGTVTVLGVQSLGGRSVGVRLDGDEHVYDLAFDPRDLELVS